MQIVLYKEKHVFRPTEVILITFDGRRMKTYYDKGSSKLFKELNTSTPETVELFLEEYLCDSRTAKIGDAFDLTVRTKNSPVITPIELPATRGARIAWALSFVEEEKLAHSYQDFFKRYDDVKNAYESEHYFMEAKPEAYAFLLAKKNPGKKSKKSTRLKPLFVWISDAISQDDLELLIRKYKSYRKLSLPEEYLYTL